MLNICDICKKYFATTSSEYERRLAQSIPETELRTMRRDYEKMLAEEEKEKNAKSTKSPLGDKQE